MAKKSDYTVPMVEKALQILHFLLENGGAHGTGDIASRLSLPKTSVFKILYTLEKEHFVAKDREDRYRLGLGFIPYDAEVRNRWDFTTVTRPIMERAVVEMGESLNLGICADDTIVVLDTVAGEDFYIMRHLIPVAPLYCSAIGKIFLAEYEEEALEAYLAVSYTHLTLPTTPYV